MMQKKYSEGFITVNTSLLVRKVLPFCPIDKLSAKQFLNMTPTNAI
jgi:hypothetical protein